MGRRPCYIFKLYVLYFYFSVLLYLCILYSLCRSPPWYRPAPEWSGWKRAGEHPDTDQLAKLGPGSSKCSVFVPMCSQFCMYVLGIYSNAFKLSVIVSQSSAFVSMCSVFVFFLFVSTIQTNPAWQKWDQYYLSFVFYIPVILKQTSDCTYIKMAPVKLS